MEWDHRGVAQWASCEQKGTIFTSQPTGMESVKRELMETRVLHLGW